MPYRGAIAALVVLTIAGNALNLLIPKLVANAIDSYGRRTLVLGTVAPGLLLAAAGILIFGYLQGIVQTYAADRVARDLRTRLITRIAAQDAAYIQQVTPAALLTHLTSDVDAVKMFVAMVFASLISSVFLIIGASVLLIAIDWQLALGVLAILPVVGVTFSVVLGRVRTLFKRGQEAIDWLNKVINESILGAALIRLVNSQQVEFDKFVAANAEARDISLSILRLFASLIPVIVFATNLAILVIVVLGGRFVINGTMTLGEFTAFNSYLVILIFPVVMIGFMSTMMAQASASYARIAVILEAPERPRHGTLTAALGGNIALRHVDVELGGRRVLKDVSFDARAGSRTAVIGPTAAGKTQLLYLLTGLIEATAGSVEYDDRPIADYDPESLHSQIGFVFQDSVIFNLSLRENIAFSRDVTDADLAKAIATAELDDFIRALPSGLDTVVSERGSSLSGGQKQRVMLARALALSPRVLLLDDFTARVDTTTAHKILENVHKNYPGITLLSVTQQIEPVADYDQIILLMEGEILASGTHRTLVETSPEYAQIYDSQRSTSHYEVLRAQ
ncbi:MAG TPA: ABC transporter ATP-binding protein [Vicinamibacterales bacterium]